MGKTVKVAGKAIWSKLHEDNRDMGPSDGSDLGNKLDASQGQYTLDLLLDFDTKAKMIKDGIPDKGLMGNLFKQYKQDIDYDWAGADYYVCKSPHFNPRFTNRDTGEVGVLIGEPLIYDADGVLYEERPYIVPNSDVIVKFDVWDKKIVQMLAIQVVNMAEPISSGEEGGF